MLLRMSVLRECFYNQTAIRYEYIVNDSVILEEATGLIEDRKQVWIHPPRGLIKEASVSPFYEYKRGRSKWKSALIFKNQDLNIEGKKTIWAKNKIEIENDTIFQFKEHKLLCQKIGIKTKFNGQLFNSTMLFNDSLGFVKVEVEFLNGKMYSIELIDFKNN